MKEEAKTKFIFASRMLSRCLVVEMEESDLCFLSLYFLKQSITVHTYSSVLLQLPVFTESGSLGVVDPGPCVAMMR